MARDFCDFLLCEGIDVFGAIPLSLAHVFRPDKLSSLLPEPKGGSLLVLLMPYLVRGEKRNISAYAVSRDYHLYFKGLSERLCEVLREQFPDFTFKGAADSSPCDEVGAAARAGLGVFGENGLFLSEKYGSYVFIGGIYSDMPYENYGLPEPSEPKHCPGCGKCVSACPSDSCGKGADKSRCLSALTQKKGALSESEAAEIKKHGSVWGCDICQEVCPLNKNAEETQIRFFRENRTPFLTFDSVQSMTDEEFSERAYSWRKRETVLRNLKIFEE